MKIYVLPVNNIIRPAHGFVAPPHNADYGVEQDFEDWLIAHPEYVASSPDEADFDYFPAYWNRYYCTYWGERTEALQDEVCRLVSRVRPTFTICEYDIQAMQPHIDLCGVIVFSASRHGYEACIDIPLLCSPHEVHNDKPRRWLASFMGKFETHGIREEMRRALDGRADVCLMESQNSTRAYADLMASSLVALAPRGYGGQSFRFYEAMQFGTVPFLIGDIDTRPFKRWINWAECSLYTDDPDKIDQILSSYDWGLLQHMGEAARRLWHTEIHYGKWCKYVLRELDSLQRV